MPDRAAIHRQMQEHYQRAWIEGDPWGRHETFTGSRFEHVIEILSARRYTRALELGCGNGRFARLLSPHCERVLALDIAAAAIERAQQAAGDAANVEFRVANAVEYEPREEGPWDLLVLNEMLYCVGWLYPLFDIAWMAGELFAATSPGGKLLLMNTYGGPSDFLLHPHLLHTYRDLFLHVGYELELQEICCGDEDGVAMEVLVCLFQKPEDSRLTDQTMLRADVARRHFPTGT